MIADVNKSQGKIDWDTLAPVLDFVIIKASGLYKNNGDPYYAHNVAGAVSHGVPFHVFHFLYCQTDAEARRDAGLFYRMVAEQGHWPLFWVLDCEAEWGIAYSKARHIAEVFEDELRRLCRETGPGEIRVALYIGHNRYKEFALDYSRYSYIWIPRYGSNDGTIESSIKPSYTCDLWQYTSKGVLPGIKGIGRVDLSVLNSDKPLEFFTAPAKQEGDTMAVKIGSARIDENGRATGGKAGDQTGKEVSTQSWYRHSKGWRVLRAKNPAAAEKIAQAMQWACNSPLIGYDQNQRETLRKAVIPLGWDIRRLTTAVETDCSALVRVCCGWAFQKDLGTGVSYFNTTTMCSALLKTGLFDELTGSKYTDQQDYLKRGDILCTKTQGHTVVVLSNGSKAEAAVAPTEPQTSALFKGAKGSAVTALQIALLQWRKTCLPKYGVDGDFGSETEKAVKAFQEADGLPVTGIYDEATRKALTEIVSTTRKYVVVTGDSVNVRTAPSTTNGRIIGVVHDGYRLPYQGQDSDAGWHLVEYDGQNGWISGKYSEVE